MSTTAAPPIAPRPATALVPRLYAALIGFLAVFAAIGIGQLVAGLISAASSPFFAVGDTVIRFSPEPLTEFAKTHFGTSDKTVLLTGMGVVIALVALAAGLASRRRSTPGVTVIAVLGVLGFLAVYAEPAFAPLDLVAPAATLVVGVVVFRWLHALASAAYEGPAAGSVKGRGLDQAVSRRRMLIGSSAAVGIGALGATIGGSALTRGVGDSRAAVTSQLAKLNVTRAPAIPAGVDYAAELGTTPFLTSNADFYRIDTALRIPTQSAADWTLRIHGMVDRPMTLTFADLLRRPVVERTLTQTCVSNEVGGTLISTTNFLGVSLRDILTEAGVQRGAEQVYTTSIDGWTAGTPTDVIMEPDRGALLVFGMNGEALPPEHGFPVRMHVPGLYGFVGATKWIADMELTTFDRKQSYWLQRGWSQKAPIKTECRIDLPRGFSSQPAGPVTVAGIAWSQPAGISKVEVRMDGGPWQAADLATEVSGKTWRMWRTTFNLPAGSHTVQCRATDANGVTQTEARALPIPDGASGWPATIFSVS